MLWTGKHKRATIRWLGYLVLAFAVLFPVGIFTGEHKQILSATDPVSCLAAREALTLFPFQ